MSLHLSFSDEILSHSILYRSPSDSSGLVRHRRRIALTASTSLLYLGKALTNASPVLPHGACYPALLFRSELKNIIHQQARLVLIIARERRRRRTGEYPVVVL